MGTLLIFVSEAMVEEMENNNRERPVNEIPRVSRMKGALVSSVPYDEWLVSNDCDASLGGSVWARESVARRLPYA